MEAITSSKRPIRRLMIGTTRSPWATARVPPGQKSFWTSTISRARFIGLSSGVALPDLADAAGTQCHQRFADAALVEMGVVEALVLRRQLRQPGSYNFV